MIGLWGSEPNVTHVRRPVPPVYLNTTSLQGKQIVEIAEDKVLGLGYAIN